MIAPMMLPVLASATAGTAAVPAVIDTESASAMPMRIHFFFFMSSSSYEPVSILYTK